MKSTHKGYVQSVSSLRKRKKYSFPFLAQKGHPKCPWPAFDVWNKLVKIMGFRIRLKFCQTRPKPCVATGSCITSVKPFYLGLSVLPSQVGILEMIMVLPQSIKH